MSSGPFAYLEDSTRDLIAELFRDHVRDVLDGDYNDHVQTVNERPSLLFTDEDGHVFEITVRLA